MASIVGTMASHIKLAIIG